MKLSSLSLVLGVNAVLLSAGTAVFLLGNKTWEAPAPVLLDMATLRNVSVQLPKKAEADLSETMQRPLFVSTRRPPPVEQPGEAAPPEAPAVDKLDSVQVLGTFGLYSGSLVQSGGALLRVDGKVVKLGLDESLEGWMLREVNGSELVFRGSGGAEKRIALTYLPQPAGTKVPQDKGAPVFTAPQAVEGSTPPAVPQTTPVRTAQPPSSKPTPPQDARARSSARQEALRQKRAELQERRSRNQRERKQ